MRQKRKEISRKKEKRTAKKIKTTEREKTKR